MKFSFFFCIIIVNTYHFFENVEDFLLQKYHPFSKSLRILWDFLNYAFLLQNILSFWNFLINFWSFLIFAFSTQNQLKSIKILWSFLNFSFLLQNSLPYSKSLRFSDVFSILHFYCFSKFLSNFRLLLFFKFLL